MKFIRWVRRTWKANGTKILGFLATVAAGLPLIDGLIPPTHKPYWGAANVILGALTIGRGMTNSKAQS